MGWQIAAETPTAERAGHVRGMLMALHGRDRVRITRRPGGPYVLHVQQVSA